MSRESHGWDLGSHTWPVAQSNPKDLIGRNWLESLFFTRTLEDNISASCDWIYAILDLLESPSLTLYVYQILDELGE